MIDEEKLGAIEAQHRLMVLRMQQPEQAEAMNRLMSLPDDEMRHVLDKYYDSSQGQKAFAPELKG
ncbi:hypothetical protein [Nevskia sp.]|uniref:hypothetical protein n=1 Tax=Nevskia sp. TaxID=1929292 RepID=UPI0025F2EF32|nr:hypothetical protein [Nevskia sp.]